MAILQREPEPYSPTATGKGSNHILLESAYDLQIKNNASMGGIGINHSGVKNPLKAPPMSHKINKMNGERHGSCHPVDIKSRPEDLAAFDDFQGESLAMHEEGMILSKFCDLILWGIL